MVSSKVNLLEAADTASVLEAVLTATQALESALDPLDVGAFEQALAARADALMGLGAAAARAVGFCPDAVLAALMKAVADADARAQASAAVAADRLRGQIQELAAAQRGLSGYRGSELNLPRFADRKG